MSRESDAAIDAHNDAQAWRGITENIEAAQHELDRALGALDDLHGPADTTKLRRAMEGALGGLEGLTEIAKERRAAALARKIQEGDDSNGP